MVAGSRIAMDRNAMSIQMSGSMTLTRPEVDEGEKKRGQGGGCNVE